MSNSKTRQKSKEKRQRIGFGQHRSRLQLSKEDREAMDKAGYIPYWFNDEYGAIQQAQAAGYVFVKPEEVPSVGEGEIHQGNTDLGDRVSKIVSRTNPPVRAYLMKQKKKFYEEDRASKELENSQVDKALKEGHAGGANIENQYTPKGGGIHTTRF